MGNDCISTVNDKQADLLYQFCKHLISSNLFLNFTDYYYTIYENDMYSKIYDSTYNEDVAYLINYQQKNGCYPPKFQELFNEWLLMRM